ncbi:MAG: DUF1697 domain-containing protein [Synergistaceae bacterium]|jgi:uncharacterized protein (DUF1697 family)|nr:DUF1697 domain-containing protein [Synergistaceae bacterium]
MPKYITLLRGVNVGGNNKIGMSELKTAFADAGFDNILTYINSGNVLFDSEIADESAITRRCEEAIEAYFGLKIHVCIISTADLIEAVNHAPPWWNNDPEFSHNAAFVLPPSTAVEVIAEAGEIKPEYEKRDCFGRVIFWSARKTAISRTRWSRIVSFKRAYDRMTVRNANTTMKLFEMAKQNLQVRWPLLLLI